MKEKTTTDYAIERCESIIEAHSAKASKLFVLIIFITYIFLAIISFPIISEYFFKEKDTPSKNIISVKDIQKTDSIEKLNLIFEKAIVLQKLQNELNKIEGKTQVAKNKSDVGDFVLYAVFVLIFGVLTSFYRFHLKEISRQEHFLLGFQRIRIAGVNSKSEYNGEVLTALTLNAFPVETVNASGKFKSPIEGHPTSDISTNIINKLFEKFDFIQKK